MEATPDPDRLTDDETRDLLRRILALIHDGAPPAGTEDRIEEIIRSRAS